jgi:hypothetical protein
MQASCFRRQENGKAGPVFAIEFHFRNRIRPRPIIAEPLRSLDTAIYYRINFCRPALDMLSKTHEVVGSPMQTGYSTQRY